MIVIAPGQSLTFGRAPFGDAAPVCDVALRGPGCSRRHYRITVEADGQAHIMDVESRGGTYVNGRRVDHAVLQPGDRIEVPGGRLSVARDPASGGARLTVLPG